MIILGIETSCDETAAAVLMNNNKRITILSNVVASSAKLQAKYGGVIPEQAAREQIKSIIPVIEEALLQAFSHVIPARFARRAKAGIQLFMDPPVKPEDDIIGKIDAIAVTYGPGLIGSLLVGVETAKTLALVWNKPLIGVNHLIGHFYANWIAPSLSFRSRFISGEESQDSPRDSSASPQNDKQEIAASVASLPPLREPESSSEPRTARNDKFHPPIFPCLGLLVSGGHTDLVLFQDHGKYKYLGGTRDDAAGECFDKCARLLGLPYPGGPAIAKLASQGDAWKRSQKFKLPRPMIDSGDFDFSFSGLKTAVSNIISENSEPSLTRSERLRKPAGQRVRESDMPDVRSSDLSGTPSSSESFRTNLAASIEQAIVDVLVAKTVRAAQTYRVGQIMIAGGVAANQKLVSNLQFTIYNLQLKTKLHVPPPELCTDNAAMIASAAFFNYHPVDPLELQALPSLSL